MIEVPSKGVAHVLELLKEFFRVPSLSVRKKMITRMTARGIILDGRALLLLYSKRNGDYMFPGGGLKRMVIDKSLSPTVDLDLDMIDADLAPNVNNSQLVMLGVVVT